MNDDTVRVGMGEMWWLGVVQGIVTLLFGIAALFWPGLTLVTLVNIFSIYVLIWGVIEIIKSLVGMNGFFGTWWLGLIFGIFGLGVGVYLVRHPHVTFTTLILLIGFTLIIRGVFDLVSGIFDNMTTSGRVLAIVSGLIAVVAGIIILREPVAGGVAFVWVLGLFALIFGPLSIVASIEAHNYMVDNAKPRRR